jgi:hypothetical protein
MPLRHQDIFISGAIGTLYGSLTTLAFDPHDVSGVLKTAGITLFTGGILIGGLYKLYKTLLQQEADETIVPVTWVGGGASSGSVPIRVPLVAAAVAGLGISTGAVVAANAGVTLLGGYAAYKLLTRYGYLEDQHRGAAAIPVAAALIAAAPAVHVAVPAAAVPGDDAAVPLLAVAAHP